MPDTEGANTIKEETTTTVTKTDSSDQGKDTPEVTTTKTEKSGDDESK